MKLSEDEINKLLDGIYKGRINIFKLPKTLYIQIAQYLFKGVTLGWKEAEVVHNVTNELFLNELKTNIYLFSSAKTFNYVLATEGLIFDSGGEMIPLKKFKEIARDTYNLYNETWLETEYNTAIGQAQMAGQWKNIESKESIMPYLTYITVHDANVSDICKAMDGVTKKTNDPIWLIHSPLQHYNCRCLLKQSGEGVISQTPKDLQLPPEGFRHNAGKTGQIFDKSHPYFDIPREYRSFGKRNFDLKIPKE